MLRCSPSIKKGFINFHLLIAVSLALPLAAYAQGHRNKVGEDHEPVMREYRGVSINMTAEEVRKKLGNPSDKGDEQDFFVLTDHETVQVVYDKSKKVVALSFDFSTGARDIPNPKAVFGSDVEVKADGSIYRRVSYPKAGYWVSYNRTAGDQGLTSLTFQRIE
jgi:hypothetical protein